MKKIAFLLAIITASILPMHSAQAQTSNRQNDCIAAAIHHEARGESLRGQIAVAEVILARSNSKKFASTPCGVILQPHQFSFVRNGRIPSVPGEAMTRLRRLVANIRSGRATAGMSRALYFHAVGINPGWRRPRAGIIGRHIFYM